MLENGLPAPRFRCRTKVSSSFQSRCDARRFLLSIYRSRDARGLIRFLRATQLFSMPHVAQLASLQRLDLCQNQLADLPESLGMLTSIRELVLSKNHFVALPPARQHSRFAIDSFRR